MTSVMQKSFGSGEIAPPLYSRTDINKYQNAVKQLKNFYVMRHGGVSNRPGTQFVGEVKNPNKTVRLIPFVFSNTQTYCLEFGDQYIRVIKDGEQVKLTAQNITGATNANPCVITYSGSDTYSNGDLVYISGVAGDLGQYLNGRTFKVASVNTGANTFHLHYPGDAVNVDSTSWPVYTSGGTIEEIYEISSPYEEADLPLLKIAQSADVITIVHPSYAPRKLSRTADTEWTLDTIAFNEGLEYPHTMSATIGGAAGTTTYNYVVTAFDPLTGSESPLQVVPPSGGYIATVTNGNATLSSTNYVDVSWSLSNSSVCTFDNTTDIITHSVSIPSAPATYSTVRFKADTGGSLPTGLSANLTYYIVVLSSTTFKVAITLNNAQAGSYVNFTTNGSGTLRCYFGKTENELEFNIYRSVNGIYGYIGTATSAFTFRDIGYTVDVTDTPPRKYEEFDAEGDYPSTITYYQQRLMLANTDNDVEKVMGSKTGNFFDFSVSSPIQDDDAVIFKISGQKVNEVYHLVDLGVLLIFTESGEYVANGDGNGTLTASSINTRQSSYNGSSERLSPIVIGNSAVYVQARGNNVRDINFKYESNDYTGDELSIYASHLVDDYTLNDWAYQKIPHSILWIVRDDGTLIGMTYVKEQQMLAWHTHDFEGGTVENVCSIPEGSEDTVYFVISRTINGVSKRYIEKFVTRKISTVEYVKILDCHLSYDGRNTTATTMTLSGSGWTYTDTLTLTASASFFASTDVGNEIQLYDTDGSVIRFTIDAYTSGTVVTGRPNRTVPASMQAVAITEWSRAVDEVTGLWHLEGETVSVYADGYVVASPHNDSYTTVTVTNGKITLSEAYAVIHVGLPITSDLETLNIDSADNTIIDKTKLIQKVTMFVQDSRGVWAGTEQPTSYTDGLIELKIREDESYDESITLTTDAVDILTEATWNKNGRVFVRQIDPLPLTILSITPSGFIPFNR